MMIQLKNMEDVPKQYISAFYDAAAYMAKVIVGPASGFPKSLVIDVSVKDIDKEGKILGYAAPSDCYHANCYAGNTLPSHGYMAFDKADLDVMLKDGTLYSVILHEILHVCGLGVLWEANGLVEDLRTDNPVYIGKHALEEYRKLINNPFAKSIPLENEGEEGTRDSHWRRASFGDEVFTGETSGAVQPLSRVTVASLEDLGYVVNYQYANPFTLIDTKDLNVANDDQFDVAGTAGKG